jgi:hypothetical protein
VQSRVYAYSWYLDLVADQWDVLVLNDYEAVLPIPWNRKYFIKYVTQPFFCQQLGIFSKDAISKNLENELLKKIPRKFFKISLQLNADNHLKSNKFTKKNNYVLALNKTSKDLINSFNKNRKRDLKKALAASLKIDKDVTAKDFLNFYLLHDKHYQKHNAIKGVLENIVQLKNGSVQFYGIRSNGNLIACVLLLDDKKRITYLVPVHNKISQKKGATTLLVATIIKNFENSDYILDFEGSMIKGVASFYKSFGAENETYNLYSR